MQMQYTNYINNKSVMGLICRFCNHVDPRLTEHGARVAYLVSLMLRKTSRYTEKELRDICFLAQLHDVGAYKTEEISNMLKFETRDIWDHSFYGYLFILYFSPLAPLAPGVLLHHIPWSTLTAEKELTPEIRELSQLLHITDRIDISMTVEGRSWADTKKLLQKDSGARFSPDMVKLALSLDLEKPVREEWKKDAQYSGILSRIPLTSEEITGYLKMLVFIIDFRSHHTVAHTITTTSISYELAKRLNLGEARINQVLCGAILHDLGKIGIPVEILEFPGKLSPQAMKIMKTHVDITEQIFDGDIDETIKQISLRHHEKLNGSGYPKGLTADCLTTEERLMAIADITSALAGTRSYKDSFPQDRIISILTQMKNDGLLDGSIVDLTIENLPEILKTTAARCQPVLDIYENLKKEYEHFTTCTSYQEKLHYTIHLKRPKTGGLWP